MSATPQPSRTEQEHTPLPWELYPYSGNKNGLWYITDGHSHIIVDDLSPGNAHLIFKAVSSHGSLAALREREERLLAGLQHIQDLAGKPDQMNKTGLIITVMAMRDEAKDLLAALSPAPGKESTPAPARAGNEEA